MGWPGLFINDSFHSLNGRVLCIQSAIRIINCINNIQLFFNVDLA